MNEDIDFLIQALCLLSSEIDCRNFLHDLLTQGEREEFAQRLTIARRLYQGETYKHIEQETGTSSTTIARIAKFLHGPTQGYVSIFEKLL